MIAPVKFKVLVCEKQTSENGTDCRSNDRVISSEILTVKNTDYPYINGTTQFYISS